MMGRISKTSIDRVPYKDNWISSFNGAKRIITPISMKNWVHLCFANHYDKWMHINSKGHYIWVNVNSLSMVQMAFKPYDITDLIIGHENLVVKL